jgi:hypothetical protein
MAEDPIIEEMFIDGAAAQLLANNCGDVLYDLGSPGLDEKRRKGILNALACIAHGAYVAAEAFWEERCERRRRRHVDREVAAEREGTTPAIVETPILEETMAERQRDEDLQRCERFGFTADVGGW